MKANTTPVNEADAFSAWLDQLPEDETKAKIAGLEQQLSALSAELQYLREALALKERFRQVYRPQIDRHVVSSDSNGPTVEQAVVTRRPPSVREGVLIVMNTAPEKEWTVPEIHHALIERKWSDRSTQASRTLAASLSRMNAEDDIERVERGVYKVVAKLATPSLLESEDDSG